MQELADLIRQVRRDGQIRETELVMARGRAVAPLHVTARVAPLSSRLVLALVEDRTRERRVEAIRRDFVANVSHELKTPVGALNLLAEAVQEAADDPEAVTRFSGRMQTESARLTRLVQQIIELSRLQGDDPLEDPQTVDVDVDRGPLDRPEQHRRPVQGDHRRARRRARAADPRQRRRGRAGARQPGGQRGRLLPRGQHASWSAPAPTR